MKLLIYPNESLRQTAKRVAIFDDGLRAVANKMCQIMIREGGIGIAAPQVGLSRRIVIVWDGSNALKPIAMVNPVIESEDGEQIGAEGCLSFPGQFLEVKRAEKIRVKFFDLRGKLTRIDADGIFSRCIQHEIDHLDGRLFIDFGDMKSAKDEF